MLTAPAAAVLAVGAANAAAGRPPSVAADYDRALRESAALRDAPDARIWARTAANVLELNARIRLITERVRGAGRPVPVPEPLGLTGTSVSDATRWCVRAARDLVGAQLALHAATAAQAPAAGEPRGDAAATPARYQRMLAERHEPSRASSVPIVTLTDADVQAVLRRLDPDAHEGERARVLDSAARVPRNHAHEAAAHLLGLRDAVHEINTAVIRRRLAAQWLVALEEPSVAPLLPGEPFTGTIARLREVVAGAADPGGETSARAGQALETAADLARRAFGPAGARSSFLELGYRIADETGSQAAVEIRPDRAGWDAEHVARLRVDEDGALRGSVLRNRAGAGAGGEDEAARLDRERLGEFLDVLRAPGRRAPGSLGIRTLGPAGPSAFDVHEPGR